MEINRGLHREVYMGVPQGSIVEPTLWNLLYDGLLRMDMGEGCRLIAYADDLAFLAKSRDIKELMSRVNRAFAIDGWMEKNGLQLPPEKTKAIILTGIRRPKEVRFNLQGAEIIP